MVPSVARYAGPRRAPCRLPLKDISKDIKSKAMKAAGLTVETLAPERINDLLAFLEGEAFSDNPAWSSCYCQCYYEDHRKINWSARTASENRGHAIRRGASGKMRGHLAYLDGKVVGWCNAAPRQLLRVFD